MESALTARDRVGVQDFVLLENFTSEAAFIENLRRRFRENLIYVRTMSSARPTDLGEGGPRNLQEKPLTLLLCLLPPPQTYIGPVLVSVNPYRDLQIYSRQHMERYRGVSFYEVPPHL